MADLMFDGGLVAHGDAMARLRALPDCSVDAVVTDPPYGLSREPDIALVLSKWLAGEDYEHRGSGFMGKSWDSFVPGPALWREVFRVLKPGGHAAVFAGTRTQDLMGVSLRLAGFEVRDTIDHYSGQTLPSPAAWAFGQGFPKSHNVSKAIDKLAGAERQVVGSRTLSGTAASTNPATGTLDGSSGVGAKKAVDVTAPATAAAQQWDGFGTSLKPAHEPILLVRKPLEGTVAACVLEHGTGALNIDGCRVGMSDADREAARVPQAELMSGIVDAGRGGHARNGERFEPAPAGRWPANLVFTHAAGCVQTGSRQLAGDKRAGDASKTGGKRAGGFVDTGAGKGEGRPNAAVYGDETVPAWACVAGCPVAELDRQSGESSSSSSPRRNSAAAHNRTASMGAASGDWVTAGHDDKGGASRFFATFQPDDASRFRYVPKPSKKERNAGCDELEAKEGVNVGAKRGRCADCERWADSGEGDRCRACGDTFERVSNAPKPTTNNHPTVKPQALLQWLVRLTCPPCGTVLDPFLGSGTTAMATVLEGEGRRFYGCELTDEYLPIILGRVTHAEQQAAA